MGVRVRDRALAALVRGRRAVITGNALLQHSLYPNYECEVSDHEKRRMALNTRI